MVRCTFSNQLTIKSCYFVTKELMCLTYATQFLKKGPNHHLHSFAFFTGAVISVTGCIWLVFSRQMVWIVLRVLTWSRAAANWPCDRFLFRRLSQTSNYKINFDVAEISPNNNSMVYTMILTSRLCTVYITVHISQSYAI